MFVKILSIGIVKQFDKGQDGGNKSDFDNIRGSREIETFSGKLCN